VDPWQASEMVPRSRRPRAVLFARRVQTRAYSPPRDGPGDKRDPPLDTMSCRGNGERGAGNGERICSGPGLAAGLGVAAVGYRSIAESSPAPDDGSTGPPCTTTTSSERASRVDQRAYGRQAMQVYRLCQLLSQVVGWPVGRLAGCSYVGIRYGMVWQM
jgi:hypothetical protein